jgi:hypothetical protein
MGNDANQQVLQQHSIIVHFTTFVDFVSFESKQAFQFYGKLLDFGFDIFVKLVVILNAFVVCSQTIEALFKLFLQL